MKMQDPEQSDNVKTHSERFMWYVAAGIVILYSLREYAFGLALLALIGFFAYDNPDGVLNAVQAITGILVAVLALMVIVAGIGWIGIRVWHRIESNKA